MPIRSDSRLLRARYLIIGFFGLLLATQVLYHLRPTEDWPYFLQGWSFLAHGHYDAPHRFITLHYFGGGLHLYADHPEIQIGPLALLFAHLETLLGGASSWVGPLLNVGIGIGTIFAMERLALRLSPGRVAEIQRTVLVAGMLIIYSWVQAFVLWRHLDDMLVVVGVAVAMHAVVNRKPWLLGIAIGLASGAKPTAIALVPLLFAFSWRDNRKALLAAGALIACCWAPFVIAAPATLHAGLPQVTVQPASGLRVFGLAAYSWPPHWIRALQLAVTVFAGAIAMKRGRWYVVPLLAFGLRAAIDPMVESYYGLAVVFAAAVADLLPRPRQPYLTVAAWLVFSEPFAWPWIGFGWYGPTLDQQMWLRLLVPIAFAVYVLARPTTRVAGVTPVRNRVVVGRPVAASD